MELFTARRVTSFTKIIRDELWDLTAELSKASKGDQPVPLRGKLRSLSFNVMTRILMNKTYFGSKASSDDPEAREFVEVIDELLESAGSFSLADYFPSISWLDWSIARCKQAHCKMDAFLDKVLSEQRPGEVPDFVEMTKARARVPQSLAHNGKLSLDSVINVIADVVHQAQVSPRLEQCVFDNLKT
ncbi:hypothetical protein SELMODRAFT_408377 [Selaginella moellendorffii]|uniref:Uncharacterized protein CYP796C2 n=1 Tax=Selaginella moellendorffii TaxID=88036 RepID=D8R838_SELML|nr:hypothetical protein SELMODRAFT_408377 [Selaginella moellendorffii]